MGRDNKDLIIMASRAKKLGNTEDWEYYCNLIDASQQSCLHKNIRIIYRNNLSYKLCLDCSKLLKSKTSILSAIYDSSDSSDDDTGGE